MTDSADPLVSVVDDDASLRRSVHNLLASVGFRVETFASAEDFLGSGHRERTKCLVLDLRMPGMTGFELLARLAALGSQIPVIVLTAHNDDEARRRTMQAGVVAFLGKPFRGDHLVDAVRASLGRGDPHR